jgi:hypothetical protein
MHTVGCSDPRRSLFRIDRINENYLPQRVEARVAALKRDDFWFDGHRL